MVERENLAKLSTLALRNRRRCGLTLRYCPTDVRAGLGWNAKGVIVSGQDPAGHWANPTRPATD